MGQLRLGWLRVSATTCLKDAAAHPALHCGAGAARMSEGAEEGSAAGDGDGATGCPPFACPRRSTRCRPWPGPPAAAASPPHSSPCTSARMSSSVPRNAPARSSRAAAPPNTSSSTRPKYKVSQRRAHPAGCRAGGWPGGQAGTPSRGHRQKVAVSLQQLFGFHSQLLFIFISWEIKPSLNKQL